MYISLCYIFEVYCQRKLILAESKKSKNSANKINRMRDVIIAFLRKANALEYRREYISE
jgi:hypothetical protein